jgi:hypothetical protein
LILWGAWLPGIAGAVVVVDLYEARVPVADHSDEARAGAARAALAEVFIKVSGSAEVLALDDIEAALRRAAAYVQQFHYIRDPEGELALRLEFDRTVINDLVTRAGAPLWTANRPAVLAWVVVDYGTGRQFLSPDSTAEDAAALHEAFSRRGVPLQYPLFDLQDAAALDVDQAWRLDAGPLLGASARYGVELVLAGRFTRLSDGEWQGEWSFLSPRERTDRLVALPGLALVAEVGAVLVAETLAARFAIAATTEVSAGVMMTVTGVVDYQDYARLVADLEQIELVAQANVVRVAGDTVTLRLHAQTDAAQLRSVIELNRRLMPVQPAPGGELVYRWLN